MATVWIILGLCIVFVLGAAVPLLRDRSANRTALPNRAETLRDWRRQARDKSASP